MELWKSLVRSPVSSSRTLARVMADFAQHAEGPWNPGLLSSVPRAYRPLASLFASTTIANDLDEIDELSGFCGLAPEALVEFRAERLVVHEALIRMTADVEVADGPNYEDLGFTFRAMLGRVLSKHVAPCQSACVDLLGSIKQQAKAHVLEQLRLPAKSTAQARQSGWISRLIDPLRGSHQSAAPAQCHANGSAHDLERLEAWRNSCETASTDIERESLSALLTIATSITGRYGRLFGEPDLIAELAARLVCNDYGSVRIGALIEPAFHEGVVREGFRFLPAQAEPFIMNIKGASASGKSSMRPLQKALAARLGVPWSDFSLISPDIWRKFLLSYESLGPAFKYAGALTAHELEIVDHKLDRYIANKSAAGRLSHLLIDRFRFDSFVPEAEVQVNSKLLTRFGSHVFLHFMITPPEATVERAWSRGQKVGRYKAVDDLLAHNIEAFSGMPELFFTWALSRKKRVHYEFLDNSVPHGHAPHTFAFGLNGEMNILDVGGMINVERYKRINIDARCPSDVYLPTAQAPSHDLAFLQRCISLLPAVNLADWHTGAIYARFESGALRTVLRDQIAAANPSPEVKAAVEALLHKPSSRGKAEGGSELPKLNPLTAQTIGKWGLIA